jgi:hypothetical protein
VEQVRLVFYQMDCGKQAILASLLEPPQEVEELLKQDLQQQV